MIKLADVVDEATPPPGARERVLLRVQAGVVRRARRGRALALSAAALAGALVATVAARGLMVRRQAGSGAGAGVGAAAGAGAVAGAPLSAGVIELPSHARVLVREGSQVSLLRDDAAGTTVRVTAGSMAAHVDKRAAGRPFVVLAEDVRVEVMGTTFAVGVEAGKVTVSGHQGVVGVTRGGERVLVRGGQTWPPGRPALQLAGSELQTLLAERDTPPAPPPSPSTSARRVTYASARRREQAGDIAGALADYQRVPGEDALYAVGRLHLTVLHDATRARTTLASYLVRYPDGRYAREALLHLIALARQHGDDTTVTTLSARFRDRYPDDPATRAPPADTAP